MDKTHSGKTCLHQINQKAQNAIHIWKMIVEYHWFDLGPHKSTGNLADSTYKRKASVHSYLTLTHIESSTTPTLG